MFGVVAELEAVVAKLTEADPHTLASKDVVLALHRVREQLAAIDARVVAACDAAQEWAADGARNMAAWLAAFRRIPKPQADRVVRLGKALRHMPHVEAAWLNGDICEAAVASLSRTRQPAVGDAFARDEAELVEHAKTHSYKALQKRLAYWRQANMPDDEEARAKAVRDERHLHLSQSFEGAWFLDGYLDPIAGTIVSDELNRIERGLFSKDFAAARDRLGRDPLTHELDRTPTQRRADALVEMARRSATTPKDGRQPVPLFTVHVDYETLAGRVCELANGTVVTPGSLVPWLTEAEIERIVFGPDSRIIDVGRRTRFFRGALRRGIEARDRECFHPTCEQPVEQVDHIEPYAAGGETTQDNGRGACGFHNRQRHKRPTQPPGNAPPAEHSTRNNDHRGQPDKPDGPGAADPKGSSDAQPP